MPDGHCADPSLPLHLNQGRGSSKKESFSLRVSPALHPPERPSPRRADMAGHGHGSGDAGTEDIRLLKNSRLQMRVDYPPPLNSQLVSLHVACYLSNYSQGEQTIVPAAAIDKTLNNVFGPLFPATLFLPSNGLLAKPASCTTPDPYTGTVVAR